jgi:hypothetical protein
MTFTPAGDASAAERVVYRAEERGIGFIDRWLREDTLVDVILDCLAAQRRSVRRLRYRERPAPGNQIGY